MVDNHQETPLSIATLSFDHRLVQLLVQHGADVNLCREFTTAPLHFLMRQIDFLPNSYMCLSSRVEPVTVARTLLDN